MSTGSVAVDAALAGGWSQLGLLGMRFTMEDPPVVLNHLRARGLEVLVPEAKDRAVMHRVVYGELVHDVVRLYSAAAYQEVVTRLEERGVDWLLDETCH